MSPRKDRNGRPLESLLAYVLDNVGAQDIQRALGISAATYYRRKQQEDYPSADELLLIARYFGMNPVSLLLSFGLIEKEEAPSASPVVPPLAVITKREAKTKQRKKSVDLKGPSL
jgi:transcriptional regulator with XRE-family HTH domain